MTRILCFLLVTIAAAFTWASEFSPQVIERALPSNIATDLNTISDDLQSLTNAINAFQGGLLGFAAIGKPARILIRDLKSGTSNADLLSDLSEVDAQDILTSTKDLIPDVKGALDAAIKKQPQFKETGVSKRVATDLETLKTLVKDYGDALLAHCPEKTREQGEGVLSEIMDMFSNAIGHFQ